MSLLQCFGLRTRRTTTRYSSSMPLTQPVNQPNRSNIHNTNAQDNPSGNQDSANTRRTLETSKALIANIDIQFSDLIIEANRYPLVPPDVDNDPSIQYRSSTTLNTDHVNDSPRERLCDARQRRLSRIVGYIDKSRENSEERKLQQSHHAFLSRKIQQCEEQIEIQKKQ